VHFCYDEVAAIMAALPFIGFAVTWIKVKWHCICGKQECKEDHEGSTPSVKEDRV